MICRTLNAAPAAGASAAPEGRRRKRTAARQAAPSSLAEVLSAQAAGLPARSDAPREGRKRSSGRQALTLLVVLVVGGLGLWAFSGLFTLAFHVGELVAVALVAGWFGYRLGHFRGRRSH